MFLNYANAPQDKPSGYVNTDHPLIINSCGTYRLDTQHELPTCRPHGRLDYQLIYIASGKGYFYFDNDTPTVLNAGNMIIFRPNEFQKYIYYGQDHPSVYWIHFTGSEVEEIFNSYSLKQQIIFAGTPPYYAQVFDAIISELQLQKNFYKNFSSLLFSQLLLQIGRFTCEQSSGRNIIPSEEIRIAINYFREHYQENINIEEYIKSQNLSISSFFRKFKSYTGLTPLQYLLEIRLSNAQNLLQTTNYSINEIALLTGYDNALYFSRLFHKHIGMSPKEYRDCNCHFNDLPEI
jgi:AraC family transcriptional regulator of arabinose operon